jgi:hypothetical protein
MTHLDELFPGERTLERLVSYTEDISGNKIQRIKKSYLYEYWEHIPVINLDQPFVRLSISTTILQMIGAYLESAPKLNYFMLADAYPLNTNEQRTYSQNWHRDPDDIRMCKMFIYLNEVTSQNGPFEYVKGSQHGGKWSHIFKQRRPHGRYPPVGEVEKCVAKDDIVQCTGKAGTVIFCDTAGLHRGGFVQGGVRTMFTAAYVTQACPRGILYRLPDRFNETLKNMNDPYQRYALDGRYGCYN